MPTYFRRDDTTANAIGYAIPNTTVTYLTQPSLAPATIYIDDVGTGGPIPNPQFSDGLGHVAVYMVAGLYTIIYSGPQLQTQTWKDQLVGGGGGSAVVTPFSGTPAGTVDGTNKVFTFPIASTPAQYSVWLNFPLIPSVGYTASWASGVLTIVYTTAPQTGDNLYVQGFY